MREEELATRNRVSTNLNGRPSWIWQSTLERKSESNSLVEEKVRCVEKWASTSVLIKLSVVGILKGYDQLLNLVLDEVEEIIQGAQDSNPTCLRI